MNCRRAYVTIQSKTVTKTALNGRTEVWTDVVKTFADAKFVRGREDTSGQAGERQAPVETWLLTVPFHPDVERLNGGRVVWNGVNYNIRSAVDRELTRRKIVMEIESGVAV